MKYSPIIMLTALLFLGAGCVKGDGPTAEQYFGETSYEQTLDKFLADYKSQDVQVLVRLKGGAPAAQVQGLVDKASGLKITEVAPVSSDGTINVGNVPFSGEITDDSLNRAIENYATVRLGGEVREEILARIASGNTFLIASFQAAGRADEIREWWHAQADTIAAVTVELEP